MNGSRIIIGAGFYGLYAALFSGNQGYKTILLECDEMPFSRASYINQARVHMGYHYPRSLSTAKKSRNYFNRFVEDYGFCINSAFEKVYATSGLLGWTNAEQFMKFCSAAAIPYERLHTDKYFKPDMCDGAFLTTEYAYDAMLLRDYLLNQIYKNKNINLRCKANIISIDRKGSVYTVNLADNSTYTSDFVLNTTYAGVNQIHAMLNFEPFRIKYELCEIILCRVNKALDNMGITVMDGPFFSIMPFGKTGLHSLTSVTFTPHVTNYSSTPEFTCQSMSGGSCSPRRLGNCNACPAHPASAWPYMSRLAKKYLRDDLEFIYDSSLFSVKPILMTSEIDDSRPTVIRQYSNNPTFISVLSGKINTVYDLDEVLVNE